MAIITPTGRRMQQMRDDLKPCPFCGCNAAKIMKKYVKCDFCMACGPFNEADPEGAWNERSVTRALPETKKTL